ncbi:MAG: cell division protein ZapA [Prevotellaceae bacterium]|jgi:cell division protein ZapA (FtsZ GTPase activity inhibitor)|nr:cell division protein ZapA [Prevotellaceae bacterium]
MSDKQTVVNVWVSDVYIPMKTRYEDEKIIREAADKANKTLKPYRERFAKHSNEEILAMGLLETTIALLEARQENQQLANSIQNLSNFIEEEGLQK